MPNINISLSDCIIPMYDDVLSDVFILVVVEVQNRHL